MDKVDVAKAARWLEEIRDDLRILEWEARQGAPDLAACARMAKHGRALLDRLEAAPDAVPRYADMIASRSKAVSVAGNSFPSAFHWVRTLAGLVTSQLERSAVWFLRQTPEGFAGQVPTADGFDVPLIQRHASSVLAHFLRPPWELPEGLDARLGREFSHVRAVLAGDAEGQLAHEVLGAAPKLAKPSRPYRNNEQLRTDLGIGRTTLADYRREARNRGLDDRDPKVLREIGQEREANRRAGVRKKPPPAEG